MRISIGSVALFACSIALPCSAFAEPPSPATADPPAPVEVKLEGTEPDLKFHVRTGETESTGPGWGPEQTNKFVEKTALYAPICTAPCAASVRPATYVVGVSRGGDVVESPDPIVVDRPGTLTATYHAHRALRITGGLVDVASVIAGFALIYTAIDSRPGPVSDGAGYTYNVSDSANGGRLALGIIVAAVGLTAGTFLLYQHDTVDLTFAPFTPVASSGAKEVAALRAPGLQPQGMALQLRF